MGECAHKRKSSLHIAHLSSHSKSRFFASSEREKRELFSDDRYEKNRKMLSNSMLE